MQRKDAQINWVHENRFAWHLVFYLYEKLSFPLTSWYSLLDIRFLATTCYFSKVRLVKVDDRRDGSGRFMRISRKKLCIVVTGTRLVLSLTLRTHAISRKMECRAAMPRPLSDRGIVTPLFVFYWFSWPCASTRPRISSIYPLKRPLRSLDLSGNGCERTSLQDIDDS